MALVAQNQSLPSNPNQSIRLYQRENESELNGRLCETASNDCLRYEELDLGYIFQNLFCSHILHIPTIGDDNINMHFSDMDARQDVETNNAIIAPSIQKDAMANKNNNHETSFSVDTSVSSVVIFKHSSEHIREANSNTADLQHKIDNGSSVDPPASPTVKSDQSSEHSFEKNSMSDLQHEIDNVNDNNDVMLKSEAIGVETVQLSTKCLNDQTAHRRNNKRNKRQNRKERMEKKERKGQRIDPSDFGFNVSCRARFDLTPVFVGAENETSQSDSVSVVTGASNEQPEAPDATNLNIVAYEDDDEFFFASIGVNIYDSGSYETDDFLDWDDLRFSASKKRTQNNPDKSPTSSYKVKQNPKSNQKSNPDPRSAKTNTLSYSTFDLCSIPNCKMSTQQQIQFLNLESSRSSTTIYLRKDKHRKVEKIHRAVKTYHCTLDNISHNKSGKKIHMHHRLLKKAELRLEIDFRFQRRFAIPAMTKQSIDLNVARAIRLKKSQSSKPIQERKTKPQNLRHVLDPNNVPRTIESDLASFLLSIQDRDLTPEDYEMLLRLDDSVKSKTISKSVLDGLKTETIGADEANIIMCVICMEYYLEGQTRKFLPCEHDFHSHCIDSWLTNSSQNCPLDNLPICDS